MSRRFESCSGTDDVAESGYETRLSDLTPFKVAASRQDIIFRLCLLAVFML